MNRLLEDGKFPTEKESNIRLLAEDVKKGNIGISLSSFEDIFNMTPKGVPFPVGAINFEDGKKRFVISWIENFNNLGISDVEEYSIRLRSYITGAYPVLSLMVGLHNGKVDPATKENLWYYGENHLDIAFLNTRVKLYQLLQCDEILFCLFNEKPEELDSFGFSLNKKELKELEGECEATINFWNSLEVKDHISDFTRASRAVSSCFTPKGMPKIKEALTVYMNRKSVEPIPAKHNWNEFSEI